MASAYSTSSWFNIMLSIERIFREAFPDIPVYRFALPDDIAEQRALIEDHALFLQLVQGPIDLWQDTYCTLWLCHKHDPQRIYTPEENLTSAWLQEQAQLLQVLLDIGDEDSAHFFPLYDYKSLIPDSVYETFLDDADTSTLTSYLALNPPQLDETGFVVRGGSTQPRMVVTQNPMFFEWVVVFQHCNRDVYQGMRG